MNINLVYGPAKCGKSTHVLELFSKNIDKDPVLIVPSSQNIHFSKQLLFSKKLLPGYCGHKIITFDTLLNLITNVETISPIYKHHLIRSIIKDISLNYFKPIASFYGFYEIMGDFISELKLGQIIPENFLKAISEKETTEKDKEIYNIYKAYQDKLNSLGLYDHEGKYWLAQSIINKGDLGEFSSCRMLLIDGFMNFSPVELNIIQSLSKHTASTHITLTMEAPEKEDSIFQPTIKTYNKLKSSLKINEEIQLQPKKAKSNKSTTIITAPGQAREVEEIAKEIKTLIQSNKHEPDKITVLFRDLPNYKHLIYEIFNRFGIPFSISEKKELRYDSLIKTIVNILEIPLSNFSRDTVFRFLKSKYSSLSDPLQIDELETLCLKAGIISGTISWTEKIKDKKANKFINSFISSINILPQKSTFKEYSDILKDLITKHINSHDNTQALNIFKNLLNELSSLSETISLQEFSDYINTAINSLSFPFPKSPGLSVQVLDVHRSRGLSFPVVFIGGLLEGVFPKQVRENPLYSDSERQQFRAYNLELNLSGQKQFEEAYLFHMATNCAEGSLYLSYPSTDNKGREQLPSYYIDEFRLKAAIKEIRLSDILPQIDSALTLDSLLSRTSYDLWHEDKDNIYALYNHFHKDNFSLLMQNCATEGETSDIALSDTNLLQLFLNKYDKTYKFSASQFNEYGTCPFMYFCNNVLGLEPLELPEEDIAPVDEGTLYHNILWQFFTNLGGNRRITPENKDKAIDHLLHCTKQQFKNTEQNGLINHEPLWEIKKREIENNLKYFIEYESTRIGIIPSCFEIAFGTENKENTDKASSPNPLIIGDSIKIVGVIDRIDITEDGSFIVIDYKTNTNPISLSSILAGKSFQLPIYILAAQEILLNNMEPIEAFFYYPKNRSKIKGSSLSRFSITKKETKLNPKWNETIKASIKYIKEYAQNIRGGKFPLDPDDCPAYCNYKNICRK